MTQRILTGALLLILLMMALYFGGWVFSILWVASVCIAMYEVFNCLAAADHRPVAWPTWLALIIAIPGFLLLTQVESLLLLVILVAATIFLVSVLVMFRNEPKLEDLTMSVLPLFLVALPGMSLLGMTRIADVGMQRIYLSLSFFIPVAGDSAAFFIGSRYGKTKLNPPISPKKTVVGAIAGLLGSLLASCLVFVIGLSSGVQMPGIHHFIFLGLLGGLAGQIGDLLASFVKRHCKVKDFGKLFPGHGGMMDRLDSVLFTGTLVYLYQAFLK